MKESEVGGTWLCPSSVIQNSGTINRLPKKWDKWRTIILWAFLDIFDTCHIAVALISSIFWDKFDNLT